MHYELQPFSQIQMNNRIVSSNNNNDDNDHQYLLKFANQLLENFITHTMRILSIA